MILDESKQKIVGLFREIELQGVEVLITSWLGMANGIVLRASGDTWEDVVQIPGGSWHE